MSTGDSNDATAFFKPWEKQIRSFSGMARFIGDTYGQWSQAQRLFAWRGVVNASWPFHSSLHRRLWWSSPETPPDESALAAKEGEILVNAHRWGLHRREHGPMSILEQLATLQHYGAPTRLIDVSFNPLIALWFAVERSDDNEGEDGRLFAIDVTKRLISEDDDMRIWESARSRPWKVGEFDQNAWRTAVWAWRPPGFFGRIAYQNGGFIFGGVPSAVTPPGKSGAYQVPRGPGPADGSWKIGEVRQSTSVALRFHKWDAPVGGVSLGGQPAYTVRIAASAKEQIRDRLENLYGYQHSTIYGDFPGFAQFATPELPSNPPDPHPT